jgi:diazepam-binding inhibitor (GABA receptor modulating acyl-CoA-binding protein)
MGLQSGGLDFVGKAKWDAWKSIEGTDKENAQRKYVELVHEVSRTARQGVDDTASRS